MKNPRVQGKFAKSMITMSSERYKLIKKIVKRNTAKPTLELLLMILLVTKKNLMKAQKKEANLTE